MTVFKTLRGGGSQVVEYRGNVVSGKGDDVLLRLLHQRDFIFLRYSLSLTVLVISRYGASSGWGCLVSDAVL